MKGQFNCIGKCRFCEIFNDGGNENVGKFDIPILKNEKYMALASVGAIVEGWTLIVPKDHIFSMKEIYCDVNFIKFANQIIGKSEKAYNKKCIIFEHGANHEDSLISCGTNHAHLHVLPYCKSLLPEMRRGNKEWVECRSKEIKELVRGKEYWFYAENVVNIDDVGGYLHIIELPESQFFRKIIAEKENCLNMFSYKEFHFTDNSVATYEKLSR